MKDDIWIWNSRARRRRSASDNFQENGLYILKAYLEANGYSVRIIDDATREKYNSLSPPWLYKTNLFLNRLLLNRNKARFIKQLAGIISSFNQKALSSIQHKRMLKRLKVIAHDVAEANLKVFGIKVWYGEAYTYSKVLTELINKKSPGTIVVAGGYHATLYEEDILRYSNFDLAIAGNGEEPLKSLLETIRSEYGSGNTKEDFLRIFMQKQNAKPLPGLIFRNNGQIEFNSRNVNRSIQNIIPKYVGDNGKAMVHILSESSGCQWNACNFCVHNKFVPVYHDRQPDDIVREIRAMIKQGIGLFRFAGSDTPPHFGERIAKAILDADLKIEFTMGCRAVKNCRNPEVFSKTMKAFTLLIKAGLRGIFMGTETANDTINKEIMNKGIVSDDVLYTIKAFREAEDNAGQKATVSLAFIYPTPTVPSVDDNDIFDENIKLIETAQPDAVMVSPPAPFKNTNWFCEADKFGFKFAPDIIPRMMEYEYVLYKPIDLWEEIPFTLKDMHFKEMLSETQRLRKHIENELNIPTDLSDEHFLMISSTGMMSNEGIREFKHETLLSILSSDYTFLDRLTDKVNWYSKQLAESNNIS